MPLFSNLPMCVMWAVFWLAKALVFNINIQHMPILTADAGEMYVKNPEQHKTQHFNVRLYHLSTIWARKIVCRNTPLTYTMLKGMMIVLSKQPRLHKKWTLLFFLCIDDIKQLTNMEIPYILVICLTHSLVNGWWNIGIQFSLQGFRTSVCFGWDKQNNGPGMLNEIWMEGCRCS